MPRKKKVTEKPMTLSLRGAKAGNDRQMIPADNVDAEGTAWATVGENIRKGAKKIPSIDESLNTINGIKKDISELKEDLGDLGNLIENSTKNWWNNKIWYAYGTSLTSIEHGKYANYVASFSGLELHNKGIPGGALVMNRDVYDALMDNTDGKVDADLITIEVGAYDFYAPLGDISSMDNNTFCGALNTCLKNVLMNCPKAQVVLMPSTRQKTSDDGSELSQLDSANSYGVTYEQRYEAIRKVAEANGVYFIPFGSGLGLGLFRMQSSSKYNVNHINHTELSGYNLAQGIWSYLKNIPLWYDSLPS